MSYDAIIVGAGPNGLAAAITLAQAGRRVLLREAAPTIGGGLRSAALTLPGYVHDVCSAIHPLGLGSPFFRTLPLERYGLEWVQPTVPVGHALDGGRAALLERDLDATAAGLGDDGPAYLRLMRPLVADWQALLDDALGPLPLPPRHPLPLLRFGLRGLPPARLLGTVLFRREPARALLAGLAAHAVQPLEWPLTSAFALTLGLLGHTIGWPFPRGGAQRLADALAAHLRALGGEIVTDAPVADLGDLPPARAVLCDVSPRGLLRLAGARLPAGYARRLARFRHGPGVFKLDWALAGPIPWRATALARAGTVHLGGPLDEVAAVERDVWRGGHPARPFVLLAQHTPFDPTRAPAGRHTAWAYCHAPHASTVDMTEAIERQVERFAPGFRALILGRHAMGPAAFEAHNPNYVGGDIGGGVQDARQLYFRPIISRQPYATPLPGLYLCSASTPPGGGVHGMCGYHAARLALQRSLA